MKKKIVLLMVVSMLLGMTGCGSSEEPVDTPEASETEEAVEESNSEPSESSSEPTENPVGGSIYIPLVAKGVSASVLADCICRGTGGGR